MIYDISQVFLRSAIPELISINITVLIYKARNIMF